MNPDLPQTVEHGVDQQQALASLTIRDYFAAAAMLGDIAGHGPGSMPICDGVAEWSYRMADAMLAERAKAAT